MQKLIRINVGCGRRLTDGWLNVDNSLALRLARHSFLIAILNRFGALKPAHLENLAFLRQHRIQFCDARKRIPVPAGSADVVYASHMVEHLDREEAALFFREVQRVLASVGTIRLALPNLRWHVNNYLESGDGDLLMENTKLGRSLPKTLSSRVRVFFLGEREYHVWMYDELSAVRALERNGFVSAKCYPPGQTRIADPGSLNLGERAPESLFVEGTKP